MKELLSEGAKRLNIDLTEKQQNQFLTYASLLREWNQKMNLTAITDNEGIVQKHFLDSLTVFMTGKVGKKVIDVGTGAGFPGLVMKIINPEMELTLLDSLNKRITFLNAVCQQLEFYDVVCIHSRAEDGARKQAFREQFDTVVSRAVANLTLLSELCLPYLKMGGYFLALKGPMAQEELDHAKRAIFILGGQIEAVQNVEIPFTDLRHNIVIIKKIKKTPIKYPRKPGIITKTPIETCYNVMKKK